MRKFGVPVTDIGMLMGALANYAMGTGERPRLSGPVTGQFTVFFHTSPHT